MYAAYLAIAIESIGNEASAFTESLQSRSPLHLSTWVAATTHRMSLAWQSSALGLLTTIINIILRLPVRYMACQMTLVCHL